MSSVLVVPVMRGMCRPSEMDQSHSKNSRSASLLAGPRSISAVIGVNWKGMTGKLAMVVCGTGGGGGGLGDGGTSG